MKWRLLAVACVLLALGLLLYPLMGELVSEKYHSDVEAVYTDAIADTDDTELAEQRRAAEAYNALLRGEAAVSTGGASAPPLLYAEQLTVGGAMCTLSTSRKSACISRCGTARERRRWNGPWGMWWGLPCLWAGQAPMRCCRPTVGWPVRSCLQTLTSW